MTTNILTAEVATINIGDKIAIEGLKIEDGRFAISVQQVAKLFQLNSSGIGKMVKSALGKEVSFIRVKIKNPGNRNRITNLALNLEDFQRFTQILISKSNSCACSLMGIKTKKPKPRKEGFVYLIQNKNTNNVKIGYSLNPCNRLRGLQTSTDCELALIGIIDGNVSIEKELHKRFKQYLVRNEWFRPSPEILLHFGIALEVSKTFQHQST